MKPQPISTCLAVSADSVSPLKQKGSAPSALARSTLTPVPSSKSIGRGCETTETCEMFHAEDMTPSQPGFRAKAYQSRTRRARASRTAERDFGFQHSTLSAETDPFLCNLKTFLVSELAAVTKCSLVWKPLATPHKRLWLVLGAQGQHKLEIEFGLLPTLAKSETKDRASVELLAKLDRGGRVARRICKVRIGELDPSLRVALHPCFAEGLMGYPTGWTELDASETQSFLKSRKSLQGRSTNK